MDFRGLKRHIFEKGCLEVILKSMGCKNIVRHEKYYTCSNPDGDNPSAIQVFIEANLNCVNYTRNINDGKQVDVITLANFFRKERMSQTFAFLSSLTQFELTNHVEFKTDSMFQDFLEVLDETERVVQGMHNHANVVLEESSLDSCVIFPNMLFYKDNIRHDTQVLFEVGIDKASERISIPIRNPQGGLVGIKGRYFGEVPQGINKYIAIHPYQKSLVLYGLHLTLDYIVKAQKVYVFESEKSVMQCWDYGIKNCVAIGGHELSNAQITDLETLGVEIILCFDNDINMIDICGITGKTLFQKTKLKFRTDVAVGYLQDSESVLSNKESFSDRMDKWHTFTEIIGG